jgi:hypothetical protein
MVATTLLFRPRLNEDINNFNFITDETPYAFGPGNFPLFREITHSDFVQQPGYDYKQITTTDNRGFYTTFLINSGARKLRQTQVQVTIEQKSNAFEIPLFFLGMFGFRPGQIDPTTKQFTPFYDYFPLDRSNNLTCDNSFLELSSSESASVPQELISLGVVPDAIEYSAGGFYRNFPTHDAALFNVFETTDSVVSNNKTYTTHDLAEPLLNHLPDLTSIGPNIVLQVKIVVYVCVIDYTLPTQSKLRILPAENIISLGGAADII